MRARPTTLSMLMALMAPVLAVAASIPQLIFEAPPTLEHQVRQLGDADPARLERAMRFVGLEAPGPPIRIILAPEGSELARQVPQWITGYAWGDLGAVVLLPARLPAYPDSSLKELLHHEVAHILVARAARGRPLPRWFNEGLAMIAGSSWGLTDHSRLTLAMLGDHEVSLAEVDAAFARGRGAVTRAYAIAGAFVRDLLQRHGPGTAAEILATVAAGRSFEEAFRQVTGTSLAQAEASFWRRQTFWYRWVPVLTSSVTLWIGVTFLAIVAIRRRRQRNAALMKKWDEEERFLEDEPILGEANGDEAVN